MGGPMAPGGSHTFHLLQCPRCPRLNNAGQFWTPGTCLQSLNKPFLCQLSALVSDLSLCKWFWGMNSKHQSPVIISLLLADAILIRSHLLHHSHMGNPPEIHLEPSQWTFRSPLEGVGAQKCKGTLWEGEPLTLHPTPPQQEPSTTLFPLGLHDKLLS